VKRWRSTPCLCDLLVARLGPLGDVRIHPMFNGAGLYLGGRTFGLVARNRLYVKVDEVSLPDYEGAAAEPFVPFAERPCPMTYRRVPEAVFADSGRLCAWADKAVAAAERSAAKRGRRRR
jgi:DNA transformation protein